MIKEDNHVSRDVASLRQRETAAVGWIQVINWLKKGMTKLVSAFKRRHCTGTVRSAYVKVFLSLFQS